MHLLLKSFRFLVPGEQRVLFGGEGEAKTSYILLPPFLIYYPKKNFFKENNFQKN
jgi:hypothetical protein